jgi:hypothetical protein
MDDGFLRAVFYLMDLLIDAVIEMFAAGEIGHALTDAA